MLGRTLQWILVGAILLGQAWVAGQWLRNAGARGVGPAEPMSVVSLGRAFQPQPATRR